MEFPDERVVQLSDMATSKVENWSIWSNTSRKSQYRVMARAEWSESMAVQ